MKTPIQENTTKQKNTVKQFIVPSPVIQKKLEIGESDDKYEVEADRVADQVIGMSDVQVQKQSNNPLVQRKCSACENEQVQKKSLADGITPLIQKKESNTADRGIASNTITSKINSSRGSGHTMDTTTKSYMESRFGTDFSSVRSHTGSNAIQLSQQLNAQAFTVGNDIYFNQGKYAPNSNSGKHLLAHELTHTLQQGGIRRRMIQRAIHPAVVLGGAAALGFLIGYGGAFAYDYLTMDRVRALRFAQSMGSGWLRSLPNCPCKAPHNDPNNWENDQSPSLQTYHPGAVNSFRSTQSNSAGRHGQQCTYNASDSLIKSGAGAGTPDFYSPTRWSDIPYHIVYDVKTWDELGWSTYNRYWQPNVGVGCP